METPPTEITIKYDPQSEYELCHTSHITFDQITHFDELELEISVSQWGSPHKTLDPHPMRIGDLDSKTTLPPQGLDPDPSRVLCCVTVRKIQSSGAMRVVCVPCRAH